MEAEVEHVSSEASNELVRGGKVNCRGYSMRNTWSPSWTGLSTLIPTS
jgi:hypothetical protein